MTYDAGLSSQTFLFYYFHQKMYTFWAYFKINKNAFMTEFRWLKAVYLFLPCKFIISAGFFL